MSLRQDTIRIDTKECEIILAGVYHRYQQSIWDVEDIISEEKPGIVCIELPPDDYLKFLEVRSYLETELKVAMITACDVGAKVFLVDWEKTLVKKRLTKILGKNETKVLDDFEEGDIPGFLKTVREKTGNLQKVQDTFVNERDAVIASKISMLLKKSQNNKIVGILGHSHLEGVNEFLKHSKKLGEFLKEKEIKIYDPKEISCDEISIYR